MVSRFPSPRFPKFPDIHRIAVLRANGLGDLVFALPAYDALKVAYPGAELVLLANPWHRAFLSDRPGAIDRVEVIPVSEGIRVERGAFPDAGEIDRFFDRMKCERFDLAVQLHGGGRYSNAFTRRLAARFTIGRRTPDAAPLDRTLPYRHYQNEIARHLETVSLAGASPVTLDPALSLKRSDFDELHARCAQPRGSYVVLQAGAGDARRRWPAERFAALADALATDDFDIVLPGQASERALLLDVAARMRTRPIVSTELSQGGLAALLSRAALAVGNDSGPTHLARACGTPTVTIFWGPNAINGAALTHDRHRVALSWQTACPVCGNDFAHSYPYTGFDCGHRASLLGGVPVVEVIEEARSLLDVQRASDAAQRAA